MTKKGGGPSKNCRSKNVKDLKQTAPLRMDAARRLWKFEIAIDLIRQFTRLSLGTSERSSAAAGKGSSLKLIWVVVHHSTER